MKKFVLGAVHGAVLLFVWGIVSWMVLPWHKAVVKTLPEEQLITDTAKTVVKEPGFYFFPSDTKDDGTRLDRREWTEKFKRGPVGVLIFSPQGGQPMGGRVFSVALAGDAVIAVIAMVILFLVKGKWRSYWRRVFVVTLLGLLSWFSVHLPYWNWFRFPASYTAVSLFDMLSGFSLMGMIQALFIRKDAE